MTNGKKYLKDGVKDEFIKEVNNEMDLYGGQFNIEKFLSCEVKPTLTEDEKVILRNIPQRYGKIKRNNDQDIVLVAYGSANFCIPVFNHLFQFIQPRRRI